MLVDSNSQRGSVVLRGIEIDLDSAAFYQSRSVTNFNTKICDKRALLSTAQPKGYATGRRWVRLKGVTVTRSYASTDEHWQSMSINGDQCQSMGSIANDRTGHRIDGEADSLRS
jgi:hypothetical protein